MMSGVGWAVSAWMSEWNILVAGARPSRLALTFRRDVNTNTDINTNTYINTNTNMNTNTDIYTNTNMNTNTARYEYKGYK